MKNNKGLLDSLNEVGSAFLELVPWRAREGLDKMITEDNERYRLVSDMISQKVDEIDAAILRSQQVLITVLWALTGSVWQGVPEQDMSFHTVAEHLLWLSNKGLFEWSGTLLLRCECQNSAFLLTQTSVL